MIASLIKVVFFLVGFIGLLIGTFTELSDNQEVIIIITLSVAGIISAIQSSKPKRL